MSWNREPEGGVWGRSGRDRRYWYPAVTTYLFRPSADIELASGIAEEYLDSLHDADLGIDEIMDSEEEPHIKKAQA